MEDQNYNSSVPGPSLSSEVNAQWQLQKPRRGVRQTLLGILAVLLVAGVAGASYYVSNQLSTRQAVAPNAPESEPQASGGCTKNPGLCSSKETCVNGTCKKIVTPTSYSCTSANCPGPAFYCSSKTNCANSPGWKNGVQITVAPTKTTSTVCTFGGPTIQIDCVTADGYRGRQVQPCCSNNTYSGCDNTRGLCIPSSPLTKVATPTIMAGCNSTYPICSNTITSNCSGTSCRSGVMEGQCCKASAAVTLPPATPTSTGNEPTCDSIGIGLSCTIDPRPGSVLCRTTNTKQPLVYCIPPSAGGGGGGGGGGGSTPTPTKAGGGGGGGGGGGSTPTPTRKVTATPTVTPIVAGACMEIQLYAKKPDGTFSTTPMTAAEKASIKLGDTLRLVVKANKGNLLARFRVWFNGATMALPGPAVYPDAPHQRPRDGFLDPQTKKNSYYDFTATRAGEYKFEGFVSTNQMPQPCGGITGVLCPTGETCVTPRNQPDATGICQPNTNK